MGKRILFCYRRIQIIKERGREMEQEEEDRKNIGRKAELEKINIYASCPFKAPFSIVLVG